MCSLKKWKSLIFPKMQWVEEGEGSMVSILKTQTLRHITGKPRREPVSGDLFACFSCQTFFLFKPSQNQNRTEKQAKSLLKPRQKRWKSLLKKHSQLHQVDSTSTCTGFWSDILLHPTAILLLSSWLCKLEGKHALGSTVVVFYVFNVMFPENIISLTSSAMDRKLRNLARALKNKKPR